MALIAARCRDPVLRSGTVARSVGVSQACLARLLRTHYRCTFPSARRHARIQIVSTELETSCDSIKEIAARAGYSSTSQLDRDFRTECGTTPGLYRRMHLELRSTQQVL
jgi:AraC-like DNA-binding protein